VTLAGTSGSGGVELDVIEMSLSRPQ